MLSSFFTFHVNRIILQDTKLCIFNEVMGLCQKDLDDRDKTVCADGISVETAHGFV